MKIIAFVGAPGSGKTEAASVAREMGKPVVSMGDVVRKEVEMRGIPLSEAGRVGDELRKKEGMDAISRRCIPIIRRIIREMDAESRKDIIVIDGVRCIAEIENFRREFPGDFILVSIESPFHMRCERMRKRMREDDMFDIDGFREREERERRWGVFDAMRMADRVIKNEGTLEDFRASVKKLLRELCQEEHREER